MKLFLGAGLLLVAALPASAQTTSVFVKGNGPQCWLDVKQIVHKRGKEVVEDDQTQTLRVGRFSTAAVDVFLKVQVVTEKNKKGEEGCRIFVQSEAGGSLATKGQGPTDVDDVRIANSIAAEASSMQKDREKKKKAGNP
jgi:hypothetical protein